MIVKKVPHIEKYYRIFTITNSYHVNYNKEKETWYAFNFTESKMFRSRTLERIAKKIRRTEQKKLKRLSKYKKEICETIKNIIESLSENYKFTLCIPGEYNSRIIKELGNHLELDCTVESFNEFGFRSKIYVTNPNAVINMVCAGSTTREITFKIENFKNPDVIDSITWKI